MIKSLFSILALLLIAVTFVCADGHAKYEIGCFRQKWNPTQYRDVYRADRDLNPSTDHSSCIQHCIKHGYLYAGLYNHVCACGNSYGVYGEADQSYCSFKCRANDSQACGGPEVEEIEVGGITHRFAAITVLRTHHPCANENTCNKMGRCIGLVADKDGESSYYCDCPAGTWGDQCQLRDCSSNPCLAGTCSNDGINGTFRCSCEAGYEAPYCAEVDECKTTSMNCQNGGRCRDMIGTAVCVCPVGYTGLWCESQIDGCDTNPCMNGGTCTKKSTAPYYQCSCAEGFDGPACARVIKGTELCFNFNCTAGSDGTSCIDSESRYKLSYCAKKGGDYCAIRKHTTGSKVIFESTCLAASKCKAGTTFTVSSTEEMEIIKCCDLDRCNYIMDISVGRLESGAESAISSLFGVTLAALLVSVRHWWL